MDSSQDDSETIYTDTEEDSREQEDSQEQDSIVTDDSCDEMEPEMEANVFYDLMCTPDGLTVHTYTTIPLNVRSIITRMVLMNGCELLFGNLGVRILPPITRTAHEKARKINRDIYTYGHSL